MANITLFVPDELKERMSEHPQMRWSRAVREIIEQTLDDFEEAEKLASKSKLTQEDIDAILPEINKDARKYAEELLNESRRRR